MFYQYDVAIIGGDLRQTYLASILEQYGFRVTTFGIDTKTPNCSLSISSSAAQAMELSKTIIAPIPFSKDKKYITNLDGNASPNGNKLSIEEFLAKLHPEHYLIGGNIPKEIIETCIKKDISYLDLMKNDDITLLNAIATAEGAIAEAIFKSSGNLHQSKGLVLGYGKCGKVLASKLHALGVKVTVGARKKSALLEAYTNCFETMELNDKDFDIHDFEYIFNTIPALMLNKKALLSLSSDTTIIDIASAPGGVDYETAKELNLNVYLCLGIPGKIAPKSSAKILAEAIQPILKERSD